VIGVDERNFDKSNRDESHFICIIACTYYHLVLPKYTISKFSPLPKSWSIMPPTSSPSIINVVSSWYVFPPLFKLLCLFTDFGLSSQPPRELEGGQMNLLGCGCVRHVCWVRVFSLFHGVE
jgi:hypothetical protein